MIGCLSRNVHLKEGINHVLYEFVDRDDANTVTDLSTNLLSLSISRNIVLPAKNEHTLPLDVCFKIKVDYSAYLNYEHFRL